MNFLLVLGLLSANKQAVISPQDRCNKMTHKCTMDRNHDAIATRDPFKIKVGISKEDLIGVMGRNYKATSKTHLIFSSPKCDDSFTHICSIDMKHDVVARINNVQNQYIED